MGISLVMCTLSQKREAMLRYDPTLVWELSREVSGYLAIGKAWDALRVAVSPFDKDELVGRLFAGMLGRSFGEPGAYGRPRIAPNDEVVRVARAAANVPPRFIRANVERLRDQGVHSDFFLVDPEFEDDAAQIEALERTFLRVRDLVAGAAEHGEAILLVLR